MHKETGLANVAGQFLCVNSALIPRLRKASRHKGFHGYNQS